MTPKNKLVLDALSGLPTSRVPVWLMRQAGRYLPEYRELRKNFPDFMDFCKAPEAACEATLQPLRRFPLDASIIFSDILTILDAMGLGLSYVANEGPVIRDPLRSLSDLRHCKRVSVEKDLSYVSKTAALVVSEIGSQIPVFGFAGSPWTVACYALAGGKSVDFPTVRAALWHDKSFLLEVVSHLTQITIDYLLSQLEAGVNAVVIFDTWGHLLPHQFYEEITLHSIQKIVEAIQLSSYSSSPVVIYTKAKGPSLLSLKQTGCTAVSVDWATSLNWLRDQWGDSMALQGQLDPAILLTDPMTVEREVNLLLNEWAGKPGYVFNVGHGLLPQTSPSNVAALVAAVQSRDF